MARNVFTTVMVTEPLCSSALELVGNVDRMWQGGYPIRFGKMSRRRRAWRAFGSVNGGAGEAQMGCTEVMGGATSA